MTTANQVPVDLRIGERVWILSNWPQLGVVRGIRRPIGRPNPVSYDVEDGEGFLLCGISDRYLEPLSAVDRLGDLARAEK